MADPSVTPYLLAPLVVVTFAGVADVTVAELVAEGVLTVLLLARVVALAAVLRGTTVVPAVVLAIDVTRVEDLMLTLDVTVEVETVEDDVAAVDDVLVTDATAEPLDSATNDPPFATWMLS